MAKMWLLIGLLILAGAGCTRRDWVGDMLVLTDVTGTWIATYTIPGSPRRTFLMTLKQSGTRVTGEVSQLESGSFWRSAFEGSLEGVVNGEVFTFVLSTGTQGEVHVDGEDMSGTMRSPPGFGMSGPFPVHLRRSGPAPTPRPQ
jgi:hypothetical protein